MSAALLDKFQCGLVNKKILHSKCRIICNPYDVWFITVKKPGDKAIAETREQIMNAY